MITGKILRYNGWPEGKMILYAKRCAEALAGQDIDDETILARLAEVREQPEQWLDDGFYGQLAHAVILARPVVIPTEEQVRTEALEYPVWGAGLIDNGAQQQMYNAMRLPVAVAGALMPDAHTGYGLPIGGVLATKDAVIPYAVGVDIACRMRLTVFHDPPTVLQDQAEILRRALLEETRFGMNGQWSGNDHPYHPVLDAEEWRATRLLQSLQGKAQTQLGTSGTGNHFVEWGELEIAVADPLLGVEPGTYLALLSHSGSRGVGFKIAKTYTDIAMRLHPNLSDALKYLAWLPLNSEPGQEYWQAMQLAGQFAAANHAVIHDQVARAAGMQELVHIENHHNFAWEETLADGTPVIVHRKGATPAGPGVYGIIPGSMGDAGYLVRGRGVASSLNSASHGAGRKLSRRAAVNSIAKKDRDTYLKQRGVTLLGGGMDEAPQAYKDINEVIREQEDLIDIVGTFRPKIVRMADEAGEY